MRKTVAKYVDSLSAEEQDRVLEQQMVPGVTRAMDGPRCLIGVARDLRSTGDVIDASCALWPYAHIVAAEFDDDCRDRGVEIVGAEIRQRILDNRAARMPAPQPLECYALAR